MSKKNQLYVDVPFEVFCYKDMHVFIIEYLLFSIVSLVVLQGLLLELTSTNSRRRLRELSFLK